MNSFETLMSNSLCHRTNPIPPHYNKGYYSARCLKPLSGRYVTIQKLDGVGLEPLHMLEVDFKYNAYFEYGE